MPTVEEALAITIDDAPAELQDGIRQFWPEDEWTNAARVSLLECGWNAFAENDTRGPGYPCGALLFMKNGVAVRAEWSIGWFQINACNLAVGWKPAHLFNTRHNCGTAHAMWATRGWSPWYFSATGLGLI